MNLSPLPVLRFYSNIGLPLVGGKLFTYVAGTSTKIATYTDSSGGTPNTNPIILNYRGECNVWLDPTLAYKFVLSPATDTDPPTNPIWSVDNISGPVSISTLTQQFLGQIIYPLSTAEILAGITPTFYIYPPLNVKRYGALGNFDASTGSGNDDRTAFVSAVKVAMKCVGGAEILVPFGNYYMGTGAEAFNSVTNPATAQVPIGVGDTPGSATNITIRGAGAAIFVGKSGQSWAIYCAQNVRITGLWFYGYTGGVLGAGRENDAPLIISNQSYNVQIDGCYFTNSLGDCITIYGDRANVNTGYYSRNITISHCVLKNRYGNGTPSVSGGTMSRHAISAIDVVGLDVHDNNIYGAIDLEPNFNYEHIQNVDVHDNEFLSGNVTAQSVIGTAFWFDETVNLTGGSVIPQAVALTSVSSPTATNVVVRNNNFEYGIVSFGPDPLTMDLVEGNVFVQGQIVTSSPGVAVTRTKITDNIALSQITAETIFVKLNSLIGQSMVRGNCALNGGWSNCVNSTVGGTGDNGGNYFADNFAEGVAALGFNLVASSTPGGTPDVVSWTPVLTYATPGDLNVVYSAQVGRALRIGRQVWLFFRIITSTFTHTTSAGALQITGVPYTSANITGVDPPGVVRWQGITKAGYTQVNAYIDPNTTKVVFDASASASGLAAIAAADMPTGGTVILIGSLTYFTA